jgi:PilZ domain
MRLLRLSNVCNFLHISGYFSYWEYTPAQHLGNCIFPLKRDMMSPMYGNLISRIIWKCSHQFSWPRRDGNGSYYQLCVNCGSKYKYDWKHMRRTARVEEDLPAETRRAHRQPKVSWTPRERRHAHVVPVLYRVEGATEWLSGTSENLSRSGLLFRSNQDIEAGTTVEIELEMPGELTGDSAAKVICKASVARATQVEATPKTPESFLIACSIQDYQFEKKPIDSVVPAAEDNAFRHKANA